MDLPLVWNNPCTWHLPKPHIKKQLSLRNSLTSYFNGTSAIVHQISNSHFIQKNKLSSSALVLISVSHLHSDRILRSKQRNALLFMLHAQQSCERSCRYSTAIERFQCRNFFDISTFSEEQRKRNSGSRNAILNEPLQATQEIMQKVGFQKNMK
jgi:hypothetical protein